MYFIKIDKLTTLLYVFLFFNEILDFLVFTAMLQTTYSVFSAMTSVL